MLRKFPGSRPLLICSPKITTMNINQARGMAAAANALQLLKKQRTSPARAGSRHRAQPGTAPPPENCAPGDRSLPAPFRRPPMDVNHIQEAQLPLADAVHLMRSLAVGKRDCPVAVHVQCRGDDSTVYVAFVCVC